MRFFGFVSALVLGMAMSAQAATKGSLNEQRPEKVVNINVSEAFIPGGFDSSSDVYAVASGVFPNSCYSWSGANVEHVDGSNVHNVRAEARVSQGYCLMAMIPFQKEVRIGQLEAGEHKIRFVGGDGTYLEKTVQIEP